jgi:nicotinamidase-related amidase
MKRFLALTTVLLMSGGSMALAQLPNPGMTFEPGRTALVVTDPQVDFLDLEKGVTKDLVGQSVRENRTIEHLEELFRAAKTNNIPVFVSPHYYYPTDHQWKFGGAIEKAMEAMGMFDRKGALTMEGFDNSGADWLPLYKSYIQDGKTVVSNPHKVYGPESNDLALQLRKHGIDRVVLAGMSANLCVEAHLRELLEQGFQVAVVKDATAAAVVPGLNGYEAALTNFRFLANEVITTAQATARMAGKPDPVDTAKATGAK